jgi:hypothetical protein
MKASAAIDSQAAAAALIDAYATLLILRHFHIIFIIFRPQLSIRFSIALR